MSREDDHFRLRLPNDLKIQIREASEANRRSMTAEINARLYESFGLRPEYQSRLDELEARIIALEKKVAP